MELQYNFYYKAVGLQYTIYSICSITTVSIKSKDDTCKSRAGAAKRTSYKLCHLKQSTNDRLFPAHYLWCNIELEEGNLANQRARWVGGHQSQINK